jgi:glutamate-1-semialdehyde 2,1-aminomutase
MVSAIVQARMGSTRLPDKVALRIKGKPLLWYVINRLKKANSLHEIVVATTVSAQDDVICEFCEDWGIQYYRGDGADVLDRYYRASKEFNIETIARITADCPLLDYRILDQIVQYYRTHKIDYVSNTLQPCYPDGMDIEVFGFSALEKAWKDAGLMSEREHVTPFIKKNSTFNGKHLFVAHNYGFDCDFSHIRLTVDEKEDFEVIRFLIENSEPDAPWLSYVSLLTKQNGLMAANSNYDSNEGYQISLLEDNWEGNSAAQSTKNLAVQRRARQRIPGMTQLLSKRPDQFSLGVWPAYYSKAAGAEVWDLDGNRYVDMSIGGIGANVLGYADPDVDAAVKAAIRMGTSSSLNCPEEVELAELLCEIHPWADQVRFARSGGEAMAIAVRIARAFAGRDKIAFCGYHGWHDWYLAANLKKGDELEDHLLPGLNPLGVPIGLRETALPFHYNQASELEAIVESHKSDLAAIVMEPIRNQWPESGFLQKVRSLADGAGAVLIADEISAGFRMNSGGAHLSLGFEPDISVFSKAIGNGYAISAIIGKSEIMQTAQRTFISSTNWSERVGPTAALATIRKHRELDVGQRLMQLGATVQKGWKKLAEKHGIQIRVEGIAPLSHFVFEEENALELKAMLVQLMLEKGLLAATSFYAMYAHQSRHLALYLQALDQSFAEINAARRAGQIANMLKGQPAVAGFKRLA